MARPNPPGVSSTPSGRGFLFLFQTLRGATRSFFVAREKKRLREAPAAAKASADGARRTSPGRRPGVKRPLGLALIKRPLGGGPVTIRGGRSRYILTAPPPPGSVAMYEKGAGRDPCHDRPFVAGGRSKYIATGPPGYRDRPPPPV